MALPSQCKDDGKFTVEISPLRPDIMHNCDVIEDVAVAYGLNNIEKTLPKAFTIAKQVQQTFKYGFKVHCVLPPPLLGGIKEKGLRGF